MFTLSYQGRPMFQTALRAHDNFQRNQRGIIVGSKVTANSLAIFHGSRILFGAIGTFQVAVSDAALLGVCQAE